MEPVKFRKLLSTSGNRIFRQYTASIADESIRQTCEEKWVKMYITRWLEAPIEDKDGNRRFRDGTGTPQGGVISPLLANLFLHYALDKWTLSDITRIADEFNPRIQGWINYYGRFRKYSLMKVFRIFHRRFMLWAVNRYKRFNGSMRKAGRWLYELSRQQADLFVHWQHGFQGA